MLTQKFSGLIAQFRTQYADVNSRATATTCSELKLKMRKVPGVYLIWNENALLYVGSTGKIRPDVSAKLKWGGQTLQNRFERYTPYCFCRDTHCFKYGPRSGGNIKTARPVGYTESIPLAQVSVEMFEFSRESWLAPSVLEHVLLQGYINEYGVLPAANREL